MLIAEHDRRKGWNSGAGLRALAQLCMIGPDRPTVRLQPIKIVSQVGRPETTRSTTCVMASDMWTGDQKMATKRLPEFHDSELTGINYLPEAAIRMDLLISGSMQRSILLEGVVHFFCTGLLEGNIVESVEISDAEDISGDDLKYFVEKEGRGQTVDALRKTITTKQLKMLLIAPSYGAELGCVCSLVSIK